VLTAAPDVSDSDASTPRVAASMSLRSSQRFNDWAAGRSVMASATKPSSGGDQPGYGYATASVVAPRLADDCFSPAMHKRGRSVPAATAALLPLYGIRRSLGPRSDRPGSAVRVIAIRRTQSPALTRLRRSLRHARASGGWLLLSAGDRLEDDCSFDVAERRSSWPLRARGPTAGCRRPLNCPAIQRCRVRVDADAASPKKKGSGALDHDRDRSRAWVGFVRPSADRGSWQHGVGARDARDAPRRGEDADHALAPARAQLTFWLDTALVLADDEGPKNTPPPPPLGRRAAAATPAPGHRGDLCPDPIDHLLQTVQNRMLAEAGIKALGHLYDHRWGLTTLLPGPQPRYRSSGQSRGPSRGSSRPPRSWPLRDRCHPW
jgi:hypothetical protein